MFESKKNFLIGLAGIVTGMILCELMYVFHIFPF